jgi:hypothetical protein
VPLVVPLLATPWSKVLAVPVTGAVLMKNGWPVANVHGVQPRSNRLASSQRLRRGSLAC